MNLKLNILTKNYSIKKIQNSGHWVHAENPKDFITSVLDFLGPRV